MAASIRPARERRRAARQDWTAVYFIKRRRAGSGLIGRRQGDQAVEQYFRWFAMVWQAPSETCPDAYLLWFHRCAWDYQMKSGQILWGELCAEYYARCGTGGGVATAWQSLAGKIDARRHQEVADRLSIQVADAAKWRDQILEYFGGFNKGVPHSI